MVTKAVLDVKGLNEYIANLSQAAVDIDAVAQRGLVQGGTVLKAGMVELVPVDKGDLQAAIILDGPHQDGNFNYVEVGVIGADADVATYGNVQEYGSPSKNIAAQSYVRAGRDNKRSAVMRAVRESLKAEGLVD